MKRPELRGGSADFSRTCKGCGSVVEETVGTPKPWYRCNAPGPRRGFTVGSAGRFLPYVPAWCPLMQAEEGKEGKAKMSGKEDLLERIRAVKALADRGERGEKETAQAMLEKLMQKYSITEDDLEAERVETAWFVYHDELERRILNQVIYSVTGKIAFGCVGAYSNRKRKKSGADCTAAQRLEIQFKHEFFYRAAKKEMEVFLHAFFIKNSIFPPESIVKPKEAEELTREELERALRAEQMAITMEKYTPQKAIEDGGAGGEEAVKLLIGGSPCTHWSIAKKGRETTPEGLGWELFNNYMEARDKFSPSYFLYENNYSMSAAIREQITAELGVEPIMINSALVSAQSRKRLYWTNIPGVTQPEDRGIVLREVLETVTDEKGYTLKVPGKPLTEREMEYMVRKTKGGRNHFDFDYHHDATKEKGSCVTANTHRGVPYNVLVEPIRIGTIESGTRTNFDSKPFRVYSPDGKAVTMQGEAGGYGAKTGLYAAPAPEGAGGTGCPVYGVRGGLITIKGQQYPVKLADGFYIIRKLTVTECKRLQTVPDAYIFPVSDTQAYRMLGNGWTVEVIAHILSFCPGITETPLEVLSMYDGMSCGRLALDKLGASVAAYWATEIDKYAIKTTQANFPDTVQLGDAFQVREDGWKPWEGVKQ